MPNQAEITASNFPLAPIDAKGKSLAPGSNVQILSVASCAKELPTEDQERLFSLVGKIRSVVEFDRFGFVWLSYAAGEQSADFALFPTEVSVVSPV